MSDGIMFTAGTLRTLAHGDVRLTVNVDASDAKSAMELFGTPGTTGVIVRISAEAAKKHQQSKAANPFGEQAKILRLSSFFRNANVWPHLGSDDDFLAWLRLQKCCAKDCNHSAPSEAAHVRRVANGAGMSIKPAYSAIPLCDHHHREQHQQGESAIGGRDYVDQQRISHLVDWGWQRIKDAMGVESMAQADPKNVVAWCQKREIEWCLPSNYC